MSRVQRITLSLITVVTVVAARRQIGRYLTKATGTWIGWAP